MAVQVKIPSLGESVTEAVLGSWLAQEGQTVAEQLLKAKEHARRADARARAVEARLLHLERLSDGRRATQAEETRGQNLLLLKCAETLKKDDEDVTEEEPADEEPVAREAFTNESPRAAVKEYSHDPDGGLDAEARSQRVEATSRAETEQLSMTRRRI